jgi:RNase P subunit RPR2
MKITCESCGEDITLPNKKNRARKTSNKNHSIAVCRQCGQKNFVDTITRYNSKREDYTGEPSDFR